MATAATYPTHQQGNPGTASEQQQQRPSHWRTLKGASSTPSPASPGATPTCSPDRTHRKLCLTLLNWSSKASPTLSLYRGPERTRQAHRDPQHNHRTPAGSDLRQTASQPQRAQSNLQELMPTPTPAGPVETGRSSNRGAADREKPEGLESWDMEELGLPEDDDAVPPWQRTHQHRELRHDRQPPQRQEKPRKQ